MKTDVQDGDLLPKRKQYVLAPHAIKLPLKPDHPKEPLDAEIVIEDILDADVLI